MSLDPINTGSADEKAAADALRHIEGVHDVKPVSCGRA
jgi:hypothetical protein